MGTLEQFALRWLQQQLAEILASPETVFPADLPLNNLPGKPRMRSLYAALRRRGVEMPPLLLSRTQHVLIAALALVAALSGHLLIVENAFLALIAWITLALLAKLFLASTPTAKTVADLAIEIFACNPMFFSRLSGQALSREHVREIVANILVNATGCDRGEITPETRLANLLD